MVLIILSIISEGIFRLYTSVSMLYDIEMHKYAREIKYASDKPGLTHEHIPSSSANLMDVEVDINAHGFRDDELLKRKINEKRVLVVGSSITMGWGVEYDSVFTQRWEKKLNEGQDSIYYNIYNSGIGNYNTQKEEILFNYNFDDVKPDEVILHYYLNDAEILPSGNSNFFVRNSYLCAFLYVRIKQFAVMSNQKYSSLGEYYLNLYQEDSQGWKEARQAIEKMAKTCDEAGVKFTVVVQPDLHDVNSGSNQEKCHAIINKFLNDKGIANIDLFKSFQTQIGSAHPTSIWVNPDDSHPNDFGHQVIYKALLEEYKF